MGMVVEYATWNVAAPDFDAYVSWVLDLGSQCRAETGCLEYDYQCDPNDLTCWSLFQAWESAEAFERHLAFPAHQAMLEGGKEWTNHNVVIRRWMDAGACEIKSRGDK